MSKKKILIVDDDPNIVFAFKKMFEKEGYRTISEGDGVGGLEAIQKEEPDLAFMDVSMPKMDGLEVLEKIKKMGLDIPVVIITGFGTMQTAIRAVQLGAYEYITKPLDVDKVRITARRALEAQRMREEIKDLRAKLDSYYSEDTLIGNDPGMEEVYKTIGAVTATPNATTVLIQGESGTGKELVARAIHNNSESSSGPFAAIKCTALPSELLESELFGYETGAFTGATARKAGKFEVAKDGTIFLDEIAGFSLNLQQKLLRVLQEREFQRLGGNQTLKVDARFIVATNKDLESEVKKGNFREDLYFRLNVIPIYLPPLRERRDDITLLADYFLTKYNRSLRKNIKLMSDETLEILLGYDWPGNVRELENVIQRCVVIEKGEVILPRSLPERVRSEDRSVEMDIPLVSTNLKGARKNVLEAFEKKFVREALTATAGNVTEAAKRAGIERQSFHRMISKYSISPEDFRKG